MNFFTSPNLKNIIATLRIVTIEKFELTFLLILCFHVQEISVYKEPCVLKERKFVWTCYTWKGKRNIFSDTV